jgi:hypothetical protein
MPLHQRRPGSSESIVLKVSRKADMSNASSLLQSAPVVRAEKWTSARWRWAGSPAFIPPAPRASVARFKAIETRINAYEKSLQLQLGGHSNSR